MSDPTSSPGTAPEATPSATSEAADDARARFDLNETRTLLTRTAAELAEARAMIARLERRARIDELLADADAHDLPAARLLTEAAVESMDQPDVDLAVADLRRARPYLFRQGPAPASGMPARDAGEPEPDRAAARAAATGDRRDLLRYLRLRRRD